MKSCYSNILFIFQFDFSPRSNAPASPPACVPSSYRAGVCQRYYFYLPAARYWCKVRRQCVNLKGTADIFELGAAEGGSCRIGFLVMAPVVLSDVLCEFKKKKKKHAESEKNNEFLFCFWLLQLGFSQVVQLKDF